jgi:hypothetical protein
MAKTGATDSKRDGAVKKRSQVQNPTTGLWAKRDADTGRIMDVKTTGGKFRGVSREDTSKAPAKKRATKKTAAKKVAKRGAKKGARRAKKA